MISKYRDLETPALLIDYEQLMKNINFMQNKANVFKVALRPHTKTHKMPYLAKMQIEAGASGITVAKVGEAEVMAEQGMDDIFIANEIVGENKLERIKNLSRFINISTGVDCSEHVEALNRVFEGEEKKIDILIEIEVGEKRSGIIEENDMRDLLDFIKTKNNVHLKGIFAHEGHTYQAASIEDCILEFETAQKRVMRFAHIANEKGFELETVSIGATPSLMLGDKIVPGITEIRPGTYILMDTAQANAIGTYERCAASVLTSVISLPTNERIITDAGAKALTAQSRSAGICKTRGKGYIKNSKNVYIFDVYDEHGIIYDKEMNDKIEIGDKIEIIPNHICPVCNLYDQAYLVSQGKILKVMDIACRGKLV